MHVIRELSNSYEMSKLAIDSMVDYAVYILDKRGIVLSSNSGAKNLTGFSSSEIMGTHFARFYTMEDIAKKYPEHELKEAKRLGHYEVENWVVKNTGAKFWASIAINRLDDHNGRHIGYSKIIKDLTSKKNNEDALRRAETCAQKALKIKSQFIADVSHEIRTPLGAMLGFAEFLQKEDITETDRLHYLDIILKNGKNLNRVINDVLDLSKIEAGKINTELNEFNLNQVIEEVIELFKPQCKLKNLSITFEKHKLDVTKINSDASRLRQILNNLIGNAIKFTDKGVISIKLQQISETTDKKEFQITVSDTGVGFTQKEVNQIFEPFVQVGSTLKKSCKGSGLGLVLSRKMAVALGGNVELLSTTPNEGSVFSLTFADYVAFKTPIRWQEKIKTPHSLKSKSILIVDDSVDNLEIIKLFLNSYEGEPDVALSGDEALLKMQTKHYDVILMDIEMPNMNGFEVIKELRNRKYKNPVIALTAHALPEDRLRTKNAGFFDHVTKPIDFEYLVSMIETMH